MRAGRLVSILLLLQTRGRLTAQQLATELEVSVRTIYRDVEALQAAHVPLYGDAGHAGGYRLLDGFRTRLNGLTFDEAESLFLAGLPGPAAELGYGDQTASMMRKLRSALPSELGDRADAVRRRFLFDAAGWYHDGDRSAFLTSIADAVWTERRVRIDYESWSGRSTRQLEPYGIVLKGGRWYVVAGASPPEEGADARPRTYRVNQILDLTMLDDTFRRPPDFDLGDYWAQQVVDFRDRLPHAEATIRISPQGRDRLRELQAERWLRAIEATARDSECAGWVTATVPIESLTHAHGELLRLGCEVEVLAPGPLRRELASTVQGLAALYPGDER